MDSYGEYELDLHNSLSAINKEQYNRLVDSENPFLEYEFLESLEKSGCIGKNTTWLPYHITLKDKQEEKLIGAVNFYVRYDSYGEFIFDWEWARAFYSAGLSYYPKLLVAIPYTPANGTRILVHKDYPYEDCAGVMIEYLIEICKERGFSSIHFLFLTKSEQKLLDKYGFLSRVTHQYHWINKGYNNFEDFLADLRSGKRKQIRKERKQIRESSLEIHLIDRDEIKDSHIDAIWQFYVETSSRKWGNAYLNREFFDIVNEKFRDRLVLVLAKSGNKWVGGTFNVVKNHNLFGRYWGCIKDYPYLHFECCYYSLIEYAIARKITKFEAGAQGEHKFLRGFGAYPTYSSHFINHDDAKKAISDFLDKERLYIHKVINDYNRKSPLKYLNGSTSRL